jgi:hypothetical protein
METASRRKRAFARFKTLIGGIGWNQCERILRHDSGGIEVDGGSAVEQSAQWIADRTQVRWLSKAPRLWNHEWQATRKLERDPLSANTLRQSRLVDA